ncbi:hypothetical protein BKA70DRAFT_1228455 [Coprinopsis sp. MPI-PUGE-AT-0042]|nr:hypothetical protein BKA70DRAFT_1228455 [Coprinopsis sp. MPI-PUGE-AT-0042]
MDIPPLVTYQWHTDSGLPDVVALRVLRQPLLGVLVIPDPTPKQCQGLFGVVFVGDGTTIIALAEGCKRNIRTFLLVNWPFFIWITVFISLYIAKQDWNHAPQAPSVGGCRVVSFGTLPIYIVLVFAGILYNGIGKPAQLPRPAPLTRTDAACSDDHPDAIGALSLPEPYDFLFAPILAARMVLLVKERARQEMGFSVATRVTIHSGLKVANAGKQYQNHSDCLSLALWRMWSPTPFPNENSMPRSLDGTGRLVANVGSQSHFAPSLLSEVQNRIACRVQDLAHSVSGYVNGALGQGESKAGHGL